MCLRVSGWLVFSNFATAQADKDTDKRQKTREGATTFCSAFRLFCVISAYTATHGQATKHSQYTHTHNLSLSLSLSLSSWSKKHTSAGAEGKCESAKSAWVLHGVCFFFKSCLKRTNLLPLFFYLWAPRFVLSLDLKFYILKRNLKVWGG